MAKEMQGEKARAFHPLGEATEVAACQERMIFGRKQCDSQILSIGPDLWIRSDAVLHTSEMAFGWERLRRICCFPFDASLRFRLIAKRFSGHAFVGLVTLPGLFRLCCGLFVLPVGTLVAIRFAPYLWAGPRCGLGSELIPLPTSIAIGWMRMFLFVGLAHVDRQKCSAASTHDHGSRCRESLMLPISRRLTPRRHSTQQPFLVGIVAAADARR